MPFEEVSPGTNAPQSTTRLRRSRIHQPPRHGVSGLGKAGLKTPEEVTGASNGTGLNRHMGQFPQTKEAKTTRTLYLRSRKLHSRFTSGPSQPPAPSTNSRKFGNRMESKGYKKSNSGKNGHVRWHGLKLKPVIDATDLLLPGQGTDTPGLIENAANIDPLENIPVAKREMPFFIENINDRLV